VTGEGNALPREELDMSQEQSVRTTREVQVLRIPSGEQILLPADTTVVVTQALGGSYTCWCPRRPGLFRLSGDDADAIGQTAAVRDTAAAEGPVKEEASGRPSDLLRSGNPVNIVDLGLIYDCKIASAEGGSKVTVKMTLTAPVAEWGRCLPAKPRKKSPPFPASRRRTSSSSGTRHGRPTGFPPPAGKARHGVIRNGASVAVASMIRRHFWPLFTFCQKMLPDPDPRSHYIHEHR